MSLHLELVAEDLRTYLAVNLPSALSGVYTEALSLGLPPAVEFSAPEPSQVFLGEESAYRALAPPSLFIIPSNATRPTGQAEAENLLYQIVRIQIVVVLEGFDHEALVRGCMRYLQALDATLRDQDITPAGVTGRSTKVRIPRVDLSNVLVRRQDNCFRARSFVECQVMHWDQL